MLEKTQNQINNSLWAANIGLDIARGISDIGASMRYISDLLRDSSSKIAVFGKNIHILGIFEFAQGVRQSYLSAKKVVHLKKNGAKKAEIAEEAARVVSGVSHILCGTYDIIRGAQSLKWISSAAKVTRVANGFLGVGIVLSLVDIALSSRKIHRLRHTTSKDLKTEQVRKDLNLSNKDTDISEKELKYRIRVEIASEALNILVGSVAFFAVILALSFPPAGIAASGMLLGLSVVSLAVMPAVNNFKAKFFKNKLS